MLPDDVMGSSSFLAPVGHGGLNHLFSFSVGVASLDDLCNNEGSDVDMLRAFADTLTASTPDMCPMASTPELAPLLASISNAEEAYTTSDYDTAMNLAQFDSPFQATFDATFDDSPPPMPCASTSGGDSHEFNIPFDSPFTINLRADQITRHPSLQLPTPPSRSILTSVSDVAAHSLGMFGIFPMQPCSSMGSTDLLDDCSIITAPSNSQGGYLGLTAAEQAAAMVMKAGAKGRHSVRPVGRPRKTPVVELYGQVKRTRGKVEKEHMLALQRVVDGKAMELLQLSAENDELQGHELLLAELVEFREMQVEFLRRRLLPMAALSQLPLLSECYPWLMSHVEDDFLTTAKFRDPGYCPVPGSTVPLEQFKYLELSELLLQYKKAAYHINELLLEVDMEVDQERAAAAMYRLESYMLEFRFMRGIITLCNPMAFKCKAMCCDPSRPMPPPEDYWLPVIDSMQLSPEQRRRMADVYTLVRGRLADLQAERSLIAVQLQELVGNGKTFDDVSAMKQNELAKVLYEQVMRERGVIMLIGDFIRMRILSPVQRARCVATAYPYFPDQLSISAMVRKKFFGTPSQ